MSNYYYKYKPIEFVIYGIMSYINYVLLLICIWLNVDLSLYSLLLDLDLSYYMLYHMLRLGDRLCTGMKCLKFYQ